MKYFVEKKEGRDCNNSSCEYHDSTGKYDQKCACGDIDGNPYITTCEQYIPMYLIV